jgi:hypothetical protein
MATRTTLGLVAALLALTFAAPTALAAQPKVTVIGEDNAVLATFKTAKCKKGKKSKTGTNFFADAISTNGKYELNVDIFSDFSGFHKYELALGADANPVLRFSEKGETLSGGYSNEFVPPFPVPGGGEINFTPNGKRMGVGFGPAMWNRDASSAVVLAGALECRYPKKR